MRLLNCGTLALESFPSSNVPAYAILSHTWEEEEVVYDDFVSERINHTTMRGWYKIQQACDQAVRDGFSYLWADTLCIDKSSSSELSETINSMFKCYRNSAICYAYLSDLPKTGLADSRWFTRGWTLQEIIAPGRIHFFDKDWTSQGSKETLLDELHKITGVDRTVLQGGSLRVISAARKMSWASKRQTTRPEDIAYSLLGLFDISMPMLYGEGSRAFIRLQEEILKQYDDQSIFAWVGDNRWSSWGFFASSPKHFSQSANIVACHSHEDQDEPITVTSRGLRIVAPLHSMGAQEQLDGVSMLRLNCKQLDFNMAPEDRIGIILFKGLGRACFRLYTDRHHTYKGNF